MTNAKRAHAGNRLKRLRRLAEELQEWGWEVKERPDALEHIYRVAAEKERAV